MKKIKLVLIFLTLMSSLALANFSDVPRTHWSSDAVKSLYNKGLLAPTLDDTQTFNGEGVFSRYEIASMLYYNLEYLSEKIESKATAEDVIALKALVSDFAPEISKMGANVEDLEKRLSAIEKTVKKLTKKVDRIDEAVKKVKISGEFDAELLMGMKENKPGMQDGLDLDGTLSIVGNVSKNVSVVTKFNVEEGEDIEVPAIEVKAKSNAIAITYFRDQDKDPESLLTFTNNIGLFDGKAVGPKEGIVFNGRYDFGKDKKKPVVKTTYLGMLFPTAAGDFYGFQAKNDLEVLKKYKLDAFTRVSYTEKVLKYQWEDANDPDNARSLYSIDGGLALSPAKFWDTTVNLEYATRRSPGLENIENDEDTAFVNSRDALFAYNTNKLKINKVGVVKANFGMYNSGEYFDIAGLGTNSTKPFTDAESEIINMEADKKGFMTKVSYDVLGKGRFIPEFNYSSYGSNADEYIPEEAIRTRLLYNAIPGKLRVEGEWMIEKTERLPGDATAEQEAAGELEKEDGLRTIETELKFNMVNWAEQNVRITFEDDLDIDNETDMANVFEMYVDNTASIKNMDIKLAFLYEKEGMGLDSENEATQVQDFDFGTGVAIKDLKFKEKDLGVVNLGMRYDFEDVVGDKVAGTEETSDSSSFSLSASHEFSIGNLTINYGGKYQIDNEWDDAEGKLTDTDDSDDLAYAIGLEYDFGNEVVAAFTYGDPSLQDPDEMTDDNFILRNTGYATGEQDEAKLTISASF